MSKLEIRIPENLQIILNTETQGDGLIVKFHPRLWAIFQKKNNMFGYTLLDPNGGTNERGPSPNFNLTKNEANKIINRIIKNPGYGFGKEPINIQKNIKKLIKQIKKHV